ncbi:MAG: Fe-S cluster assembly protein SufD [Leptolyngbyaceae cyanobacterium MO_188.B28]|nr:Fe-S cluster assembly protein SufD [Leptolyngbyaceae cyanobacterium MO_188.B28]
MSIQTSSDRDLATPTQASADRDAYLKQLLQQVSRQSFASSVMPKLGETATALVHEQSLPTTRDEEWRFTDLSTLLKTSFAAAGSQRPTVSAEDLAAVMLPETQNSRLVFVNGVYAPELSAVSGLPEGVWVGGLIEGYADPTLQLKIAQRLAQQSGSNEVFTALNTAGFQDAALIWVKRNQIVEQPIHVLFVSVDEGQPVIDQPRCLAIAEANSGVTLIEEYWGLGDHTHFTNGVTEIWLEENAQVNHSRIQRQGSAAVHIGKTAVSQARDSRYVCNAVSLGANLSRHNLEVFQSGEQTDTRLYGLSAIAHTQLADTHSVVSLTKPHGSFEQLHKSIVDNRAHAVFNGKVFVPQAAQLTNASQLNRNLMLSGKARVDTKPQLEIVADNVKCAHGATVSQLEADEIFYLQSRGISQDQAQRLLIYGFAMEIIEKIPILSLKQTLTEKITEWTN